MTTRLSTTLLFTTALIGTLQFSPTRAWAVSDEEFAAMQKQMGAFAAKLEKLEGEQAVLKAENTALKEQNNTLRAHNDQLQDSVTAALEKTGQIEKMADLQPAAGAPVTNTGNEKNGMLLPGTNTRLKLGGYIKADAIHDVNMSRTGSGEDYGLYAAIPLDGSAEEKKGGNTRIHARQTRINLTATTPTDYGDLKMFIEGDFFAGAGSQTTTNAEQFGLRHAYGELGGFLIGQTWSNFMDMDAYPESLDFVGVAGNTLLRQGQIRYTYQPDGSKNSYSVALENPSSDFMSAPANTGTDSSLSKYPDLVARARFAGDFGEFTLKGVGRQIKAYNSTGSNSDTTFGYALGASGLIKSVGKDDIRFQVAYGDGIGRYLFDLAAASQSSGFNASADSLENVTAWGGYVAYRHWWTDALRSNFMVGTTQAIDNPSFLNPSATNKSVLSANTNLIWSATDKVDVGMEYIYGYRELESGDEGTLHRVQMSATYKF